MTKIELRKIYALFNYLIEIDNESYQIRQIWPDPEEIRLDIAIKITDWKGYEYLLKIYDDEKFELYGWDHEGVGCSPRFIGKIADIVYKKK